MDPFDHGMTLGIDSHLGGDTCGLVEHEGSGPVEQDLGHLSGSKRVGKLHLLEGVIIFV